MSRATSFVESLYWEKLFDQDGEKSVGELFFVCPLGISKDSVEMLLGGCLDVPEALLDLQADVRGYFPHVVPVASVGDVESVKFRKGRILFVSIRLIQRVLVFLVADIRDALKEEHWEDVSLEVRPTNRPLQDPSGFGEVLLELGERELVHSTVV